MRALAITLVLSVILGCSADDPLEVRLLKEEIDKHQRALSEVNSAKLNAVMNGFDTTLCNSTRAVIDTYDSLQSLLNSQHLLDPSQLPISPTVLEPDFLWMILPSSRGIYYMYHAYFNTNDVRRLMNLTWYPKDEWLRVVPIESLKASREQADEAFDYAVKMLLQRIEDSDELTVARNRVAMYEQWESTIRKESTILEYLRDSLASLR